MGENNFVASFVSFFKQVPARKNIRAVVETFVWTIERNKLKQLQNDIPSFKNFYVDLLEWQICCIDESRLEAIMLNAPAIRKNAGERTMQQIPMLYLASIPGDYPTHLSRIRNNISGFHL